MRRDEVLNLVDNADFDRVFKRTIDFAKDFASDPAFQREAVLHSGNYTEIKRERRRGLSHKEFMRRRNEFVMNVMELLDDIVDQSAGLGDL